MTDPIDALLAGIEAGGVPDGAFSAANPDSGSA
jgi:hypothetical protein